MIGLLQPLLWLIMRIRAVVDAHFVLFEKSGQKGAKNQMDFQSFMNFHLFCTFLWQFEPPLNQLFRDAAGHYPTRATRPVTRPVLNRPNYPYYPWPAGIWTIFDPTRPVEAHENHYPLTRDNFQPWPARPVKKLLLTRITRDIISRNIFTKS